MSISQDGTSKRSVLGTATLLLDDSNTYPMMCGALKQHFFCVSVTLSRRVPRRPTNLLRLIHPPISSFVVGSFQASVADQSRSSVCIGYAHRQEVLLGWSVCNASVGCYYKHVVPRRNPPAARCRLLLQTCRTPP